MRNLEDRVNFVKLWYHDSDALIGGVTVFTGNQCGTTSKYVPGPLEGGEERYPQASQI